MVKYSGNIDILSFSAVDKAGKILSAENATNEEYLKAWETLSVFRAAHSYPIATFQAIIRNRIKKIAIKNTIVAQRLKRAPSIIAKLRRFPTMNLSQIQDIGGLRVIVPHIDDVYKLHKEITNKKIAHEIILPPKDYIKTPKEDGYRSLHQVFRYKNKKHPELNGLRIELQIRTKLQHSWATAVETLGLLERSSFKTGQWKEKYKQFFQLTSQLFAIHETKENLDNLDRIKKELRKCEDDIQAIHKLLGLALAANHIDINSKEKADYHILTLDMEEKRASLISFSSNQFDDAKKLYSIKEQEAKNNNNIDVVLISVGDVKEIKRAYPNYFLDTRAFVKFYQELIK